MWININESEHATILAALRFWQRAGNTGNEPENVIATNEGELEQPLDTPAIDALCERINTVSTASAAEVAGAQALYEDEQADIEVDEDAGMSRAEDGTGTWVMGWLWLPTETDNEAGAP